MLRKMLPWVVLVVVLFSIAHDPTKAAGVARHLGGGLASAAEAVVRFCISLLTGR